MTVVYPVAHGRCRDAAILIGRDLIARANVSQQFFMAGRHQHGGIARHALDQHLGAARHKPRHKVVEIPLPGFLADRLAVRVLTRPNGIVDQPEIASKSRDAGADASGIVLVPVRQ